MCVWGGPCVDVHENVGSRQHGLAEIATCIQGKGRIVGSPGRQGRRWRQRRGPGPCLEPDVVRVLRPASEVGACVDTRRDGLVGRGLQQGGGGPEVGGTVSRLRRRVHSGPPPEGRRPAGASGHHKRGRELRGPGGLGANRGCACTGRKTRQGWGRRGQHQWRAACILQSAPTWTLGKVRGATPGASVTIVTLRAVLPLPPRYLMRVPKAPPAMPCEHVGVVVGACRQPWHRHHAPWKSAAAPAGAGKATRVWGGCHAGSTGSPDQTAWSPTGHAPSRSLV